MGSKDKKHRPGHRLRDQARPTEITISPLDSKLEGPNGFATVEPASPLDLLLADGVGVRFAHAAITGNPKATARWAKGRAKPARIQAARIAMFARIAKVSGLCVVDDLAGMLSPCAPQRMQARDGALEALGPLLKCPTRATLRSTVELLDGGDGLVTRGVQWLFEDLTQELRARTNDSQNRADFERLRREQKELGRALEGLAARSPDVVPAGSWQGLSPVARSSAVLSLARRGSSRPQVYRAVAKHHGASYEAVRKFVERRVLKDSGFREAMKSILGT